MWKNSLALAVSACLCIVAAEVALRFFTPFPLGTMTHRLPDPNLGYKLDPALLDVDDNGFRNAPGKRDAYEVAAIGDSMTYGNNVASAESWPAAFERLSGMSTYNYGVGSYGIYSYHALVRQELERGDKKIIVALNIGNDFAKAFSYCDILKAQSVFWREEKSRLALHELEILESRETAVQAMGAAGSLEGFHHRKRRTRQCDLFPRLGPTVQQERFQLFRIPGRPAESRSGIRPARTSGDSAFGTRYGRDGRGAPDLSS